MKKMKIIIPLVFALLAFISCSGLSQSYRKTIPAAYEKMGKNAEQAYIASKLFLDKCKSGMYGIDILDIADIDTIKIDNNSKIIEFEFNRYFARRPFREETVKDMYTIIRDELGRERAYDGYEIILSTTGTEISSLVPNYYINNPDNIDTSKYQKEKEEIKPLVRNNSKPIIPSKGLCGRHIALWNSHGWYYENSLDRWEWQRARNFQVVEDIFPTTFVIPYILPMLENAGAVTFLPRERDFNTTEMIIDNDFGSGYSEKGQWMTAGSGFSAKMEVLRSGDNPFESGSSRKAAASSSLTSAEYTFDVPETAEYCVYISYRHDPENVDDAKYTVHHAGGKTEYLVNQQIGGETWIYLGKFKFMKNWTSKIVLSANRLSPNKYISADAVKIGGGMGNVERNGKLSERPRWVEASRYYLQYAGIPDYVYNIHEDTVDYNDDYKCRGEWVNYLKGAPFGPTGHRDSAGLGIPIDMSFAFHTDAGTTRNDTVVGTLLIYSRRGGKTDWDNPDSSEELTYPNGQSRFAGRDLADIMQTQIVDDIRAKYDIAWNHRGMWDAGYSEAWRPNVPGALLELLSHHNYLDMKFGNDPQFRFDVSRSIYKAILKFLAEQNNSDYRVQPLPPDHFTGEILHGKAIRLKWREVHDPLESTASADKYIVYKRENNGGFDTGILVNDTECLIPDIHPGVIYSFKVTAVNDGGESFPSEIISLAYLPDTETVLIVNAFDRVSGPATLETDNYLGFMDFWEKSVPDRYDLAYTGSQYDFDETSKWLDDDSPGNGASYADFETTVIRGNTFDFPYVHGRSILNAGYSFATSSDEAFSEEMIDASDYPYLDIIYGEQKATPWPKGNREPRFRVFPKAFRQTLENYVDRGGNIFVSGAYIGTDCLSDTGKINFINDILKFRWRTDHASREGGVYYDLSDERLIFETGLTGSVYGAENPDGIEPVKDSGGITFMRYTENNVSAASVYQSNNYNTFAMGFPFECIDNESQRDKLMKNILDILSNKYDIMNKDDGAKDARKKSSNNKK